jgi:hypothetical protein
MCWEEIGLAAASRMAELGSFAQPEVPHAMQNKNPVTSRLVVALRFIFCGIGGVWLSAFSGMVHAQDAKDDVYQPPKDSRGREYDTFAAPWLAAMTEPSLVPAKGSAKDFALRFFWLRSFHDPISIRIWRTGSNYRVRAVRMVKQNHYGPAPIAEDTTRDLKPEEWTEVTRLMEGKRFWTPLSDEEREAIPRVRDGSMWFFERLADGNRSYLELICTPDLNTMIRQSGKSASIVRDFDAYVRLGAYLLQMTSLTPKRTEDFY